MSSRALVLACLLLAGCSEDLLHDVNESDANEVVFRLNERGVHARKWVDDTGQSRSYRVAVPSAQTNEAIRVLRESGLPRPHFSSLPSSPSALPSPSEQHAALIRIRESEINDALIRLDGIVDVSTIVNVRESESLLDRSEQPAASAAVIIRFRPRGDGVPSVSEDAIRRLVAAAVPELRPERVAVLMSPLELVPQSQVANQWDSVLGIRVAADSATALRILLATLALFFLGAALSGVVALRRRPAAVR